MASCCVGQGRDREGERLLCLHITFQPSGGKSPDWQADSHRALWDGLLPLWLLHSITMQSIVGEMQV